MERLTKRTKTGELYTDSPLKYYNYSDYQAVLRRLAHYEDLEEQGRLVVLPAGNEPLSEKDLRLVVEQPVYIVDTEIPNNTGWVIWDAGFVEHWLDEGVAGEYGLKWSAFRYPPSAEAALTPTSDVPAGE